MILSHQHFDLLQKTILERVVFVPPFKAQSTMHDEACFIYALHGTSRVYGSVQSNNLNSQEGVVMKCGSYLNNWLPTPSDEPCEAIAVHFYPEVLKLVYADQLPEFLTTNKKRNSSIIEKVNTDQMIQNYITSLSFYFQNPSIVTEELIVLKVRELILLLVNSDRSERIRSILSDLFNPTDYTLKEVVNTHLFEDLSINDLAVLCNLSVSSFKRKFREVFNESPGKYIRTKRLEKAAHLLQISKDRITEICYQCGFSNIGHFSKSFVAHYQCTPTEYRNQSMS